MGMFIRIYYGGSHKDIALSGLHEFSIGSGTKDDFFITDTGLEENHVKIVNDGGIYKIICNGEVYLKNKPVQSIALEASQIFILSKKHKVSMLVIDEYSPNAAEVNLLVNDAISIGRNPGNNIVFASPIVSGEHARIVKKGNEYYVQDQRSMNGTYINSKCIKERSLNNGDEIVIGDCKIVRNGNTLYVYGKVSKLNVNTPESGAGKAEDNGRILFKRSPRLRLEVPTGNIEIQSPPGIGSKPERDWLSMLQPLMITLPMAVIMGFFGPSTFGIMYVFSAASAIIGVIMTIRNFKKQTKQYEDKESTRLKKYTDHIEQVSKEIEKKRQEQLAALTQSDPNTNECFNIVKSTARRLWERRPSDTDFMNIRVGSGEIDFSMDIQIPKQSISLEEDELKMKPQAIYDKYNRVPDAPITCSLLEYPICGIVGNQSETAALINNMVAQVATHHFYNEVKIVSVYDKLSANDFEWFRNLPHAHNSESGQLLISKTKIEADACFKAFDDLFKKRRMTLSNDNSYAKSAMQLPYYLFVISAPSYLAKNNPMNDHLFRSKNLGLGIGVIFAVEDIVQLPPECELIIEVNGKTGRLYNKNTSSSKQTFIIDSTSNSSFEEFGRKIKPIYCEDTNTKNTVPTKYSFYEMLGIKDANELNLEQRWKESDIRKSVAAPLGIYGQNDLLMMDIDESAHGPHGLVAGKTGSGKSEVLLSYLVAMASLYHPHEVQFVIIDFKGGGMSDRLENLPHMNTSITNIDGNGINRSLESINAELVRRQKVLSEASAKDIKAYMEKYKSGQVSSPLPHLVIVVDEFAELKQNYPDFMKNLISAARIGRSLGVHLILATQSPAGVVDEQIWNNSNFKLSLMVLDETSSNAVLKSPLAAHITVPGRGYLKVGNGELFELFQSGYSGMKITDSEGNKVTQLDAVINCINKYCCEKEIEEIPSICLPPLPTKLVYDDRKTTGECLTIGLYDDPKGQQQGDCEIDVFNDNTMIIGSAQSGKTNLLQTIIRALTSNYSPEELNMYIVDFSSMILKNYETLNHIGGVVTSSEDEKLKNLFKLLNTEIETRKAKQLSVGVSSFASYKEAGYKDMPQIVVIIDNLTALKELYFQDDDILLNLCAEGTNYGITFVIGNAQTSGIGYKYLAHFSNRIALYCNDSSEYMSLFEHCRERLADIPGRALVDINKNFYECQTYLAFDGQKEFERANQIKSYITKLNERYSNICAKKIPSVPDVIKADAFVEVMQQIKNNNYALPIGIDYVSVEPVAIDLNTLGMLGISGKETSGKHNFIKYIVNALDRVYTDKSEVYVFDGISRKLSGISKCNNVKAYEILSENAKDSIRKIEAELESRYTQLASGNNNILENANLVVLVINSIELLDELCADASIANSLRNITSKYKSMNVVTIIGSYENKNIPYAANEFVKKIKEDKHILFFDNLANLKIFDVPLAISRQFKKPIELGDGYYMRDNECIKVKTVLNWDNK